MFPIRLPSVVRKTTQKRAVLHGCSPAAALTDAGVVVVVGGVRQCSTMRPMSVAETQVVTAEPMRMPLMQAQRLIIEGAPCFL
jgi:hypothetical protein